jgi:glutamyl-tRNA synthetase
MRTRFAPSPTGDLHLGGAWTALASYAYGGRYVLRVEDLDPPRVVKGSAERIIEDLKWLGLEPDEGPTYQSQRTPAYEAALDLLTRNGLTYPCDCSRAEIARVASAPHPGEEGPRYPGTCRDASPTRAFKRPPAIRLRVPEDARIVFHDALCGEQEEDVGVRVGDFVLRRGDDVFAYQLAVAVDDAEMAITDVVRADDLLGSTARQILLMKLLGHTAIPRYAHVPLVVAPDGSRLAKRTPKATVRELRERGITATEIVRTLAEGLGLAQRTESLADIVATLRDPSAWRKTPWPIPW